MFDLGSGDGRIVIMAAQKYKADATGVELDDVAVPAKHGPHQDLGLGIRRAHHPRRPAEAGLLLRRSAYRLSAAGGETNKVTPILEKQLKKGARIVAHDFEFSAWTPAKVLDIDDDGEGRSHRLYLYRR